MLPNPGWLPAAAAVKRKYDVKAQDIDNPNDQPPNPRVTLSKYNSPVCDIVVDTPMMCGLTFESQPAFVDTCAMRTQELVRTHAIDELDFYGPSSAEEAAFLLKEKKGMAARAPATEPRCGRRPESEQLDNVRNVY